MRFNSELRSYQQWLESDKKSGREASKPKLHIASCNSMLTAVAAKPQNFLTFCISNLSDLTCHLFVWLWPYSGIGNEALYSWMQTGWAHEIALFGKNENWYLRIALWKKTENYYFIYMHRLQTLSHSFWKIFPLATHLILSSQSTARYNIYTFAFVSP